MLRTAGVLAALLLLAATGFAQHLAGPMGFDRPPGLGPALDRTCIAQFRDLQNFLTTDLGLTLGEPPTVRAGLEVRRFWGAFELDSFYRNKFKSWKNKFFTTPGAMALGIDVRKLPYLLTNVALDYNGSQLGDYHGFRLESTAHKRLAEDAKKLHVMAQGYIDLLEARLKFEAEHTRFPQGGGSSGSTGSTGASGGGTGSSGNVPGTGGNPANWPRTPTSLLDVVEGGEAKVLEMMKQRRAQREGR